MNLLRTKNFRSRVTLAAGFGIPILFLLLISFTSYSNIGSLEQHNADIDHSNRVQIEMEELMSLYASARAGWRSYLLSEDPAQAENHWDATRAIPEKITTLKYLTAENPLQQQRINDYAAVANQDLATMRESINQFQIGKALTPEALMASMESVNLHEPMLDRLFAEMKAAEKSRRAEYINTAERSAQKSTSTVLVGSVLSLVLLIYALGLLRRESHKRDLADQSLKTSEELLQSIAETALDAVISSDRHGNIIFWNGGATRIFGYDKQEMTGAPLLRLIPERFKEAHARGMQRFVDTRQARVIGKTIEVQGIRSDGDEFPMELSLSTWEINDEIFFTSVIRDITQRINEENALRSSEENLRIAHHELEGKVLERTAALEASNEALQHEVVEHKRTELALQRRAEQLALSELQFSKVFHASPAPMIIVRARDSVTLDANASYIRLVGFSREELLGHTASEVGLVSEEERQQLREKIIANKSMRNFEMCIRTKSQKSMQVLISVETAEINNEPCFLSLIIDVTENKQAQERVHYMAHHDALTGLPNRTLMLDRIGQAIVHARRTESKVALMFIDLDHFKHINDSLGHLIGDKLLQMAAQRLQACLREEDSVARFGGDEFVVILPDLTDSQDITLVADKVLHTLDQPFYIEDNTLHVSGSVGIALYPDDSEDTTTLMRAADTAMYHAKESGRNNYQFFMPTLNKAAQHRLDIEGRLRKALQQGEFVMHYQPQVDMKSGTILSAEALLRWKQPNGAPMSCGDFIAHAEQTGLILPIGEWAMKEACRQLKLWHERGFVNMRISVNLSPRQLHQPHFEDVVQRILKETGVPAQALELEITEGTMMQHREENLETLNQLNNMGVRLALDDFGTGYSSLAYLQRFPVNTLKIDQSFVQDIGRDPNDRALVTAIIAMANSLDLDVTAEGVETWEQAQFLMAQHCATAQGFYFGKAISAEVFGETLMQASLELKHVVQ